MIEQSNTQKVLKGVSTQTIITILTGIIEIVGFSIMSRLLTQQDFGYYAAISAITAIFAAFADAGIGSAIVQRKNIDQKYIDNAFTLCLLFGLFGMSLLLIFSGPAARYVADDTMRFPLMLVAITLLTGTLASVNFSILQRKLQFLRMGVIRITSLILTTIVSIILAVKGFGYYAIIAKVILYSLITLLLSFIAAHTRYHLSFDIKVYREIFGFGGWLMASSFFRKIAEQIDRLMMSNLFNVTTLGMYSRPKEFINNMTDKFCSIFDSSMFPVLSSIQDEKDRLIKSYEASLYYLNIAGLLITLTFMFNSELIIRIFLGSEWMNVNTLFIILSLSGLCMINGSLGDIFLRSLAFTKQQFLFRILQAFLSIVLILLAARLGLLAVAVAYLIAYSIVVFVKMVFISNKVDYELRKALVQIFKSYQVALIYLPAYFICMFMVPNTMAGNIIKLLVFCLITLLAFIFFPSIVGVKYKTEMHNKILSFVSQKIFKKNK